jgi:hypothetical protein
MQYQFRPIDQWPGERTKSRKASQFRVSFSQTIDLLERELGKLAARNIVIQADVEPGEIRLDGMLRADARPRSPAIVLSFDSRHGPLSYPCDRYDDWQDNLRAIALSLEALRSVDRYGVTRRAEQYKGWTALPPPAATHAFPSAADAATLLVRVGGGDHPTVLRNRNYMEEVYRRACAATHPDHYPEHAETFKQVQAAKDRLDKHFGAAA